MIESVNMISKLKQFIIKLSEGDDEYHDIVPWVEYSDLITVEK